MDRISMSLKERTRLAIFSRFLADESVFSIKKAAHQLNLSYRQTRRLFIRFKADGAKGIVHRLNGKRSNRALDTTQKQKVHDWLKAGVDSGRLVDFGPQILCEVLHTEQGVLLKREVLRRWMLEWGCWRLHRKRKPHRKRRERKEHFGEMLQMDGSFHNWFEDRGEKACLLNLVDDATGNSMGFFDKEETIYAASMVLAMWIDKYGIPCALYVDLRNMYGHLPNEKELMEGEVKKSTFGKMCSKLNIQIIFARSPQAKGRVERLNGIHQDRMIKFMRLKGICKIEDANRYMKEEYFPAHNRRFSITPTSDRDYHKPKEPHMDMNKIFSTEHPRSVSKDWVVRFENRLFQIQPLSAYGPAASQKAVITVGMDGQLEIIYRQTPIAFREITPKSVLAKFLAIPSYKRPKVTYKNALFEKNIKKENNVPAVA